MVGESRSKDINVGLGCIGLGVATLVLGGNSIQSLGYLLTVAGSVTTIIDIKNKSNPYQRLFENVKLESGGITPRFIRKRATDYGHSITFSLPTGLSTKDFEKNKLAIEQYLNKKVDIGYDNYRVFMKVYENKLEHSPDFQLVTYKNPLEFSIGVTYGGKVVSLDLEKSVHLLIAGETGSGKSTLLRGIITHLITNTKNINLHLIDLKNGAEFNIFKKCKKVKTFSRNIADAENVLFKILEKIDKRYDLFYENDVVDIQDYNRIKGLSKLKYEVVIIDEFADLQKEKESISIIETLTAKARACGIHIIISTQRPSANIINGMIKANVPIVIGLKTMNSLNSRIIIDEDGLEKLRGAGHGILKTNQATEFQSMYLTTEQTKELIKHTCIEKSNKKPNKTNKPTGIVSNIDFIRDLKGDWNDNETWQRCFRFYW